MRPSLLEFGVLANRCSNRRSAQGNTCPVHRSSSTTFTAEDFNTMLKVIGTALLTAFVTSMFWIWFYNFMPEPRPSISRSGPVVTVKPENGPPVVVAEQVQVRPSGLALPVVGIKPD